MKSTPKKNLLNDVKKLLLNTSGLTPSQNFESLEMTLLHGDASNRIYYRVCLGEDTWILMERPIKDKSEEISNGPTDNQEYSFLNIHRYLESANIRVPKIFSINQDQTLLLLEDLGSSTLEKRVKTRAASIEKIYQKAILNLIKIQSLKKDENCISWSRSFDAELLNWEFEHFIEWGLEKSQSHQPTSKDLLEIRTIFSAITDELIRFPTCFCHRDYQSRNLMFSNEELVTIDFQDALQGPIPYDLVALLRDSYIELSDPDLDTMLNFYTKNTNFDNKNDFTRMFDLQTIQRKLKDAGRFHYINLFKKNPDFLPYIPASYRYVKRAFENQPEGKKLMPILAKYLRDFSS